jgi:SNF2 family DNA or RNA helicase
MTLTQIIRQECKKCGKIAVEASRLKIGTSTIIKLACGHILAQASLESSDNDYDAIVFSDGCKPRPYQIEAVRFAESSNIRCIIADEQGLGKTIEVLSLLRLHPEKLLPAIIVCPSTVKLQWLYEIHRICAAKDGAKDKKFLTQVIQSGKEMAVPGFQLYVVTYDMLKKQDIFKLLPDDYVKTIVIDECQRIKNHLSDRAKAVQRVAKKTDHIVAMSGTPIKNNAGEYFTVLNLVRPTAFPHYQRFIDGYCDVYNSGYATKVGGLKNPARFHEDTKDIIIRRTKADVLPDLPILDRKFHHVELDRTLNKAYATALEELEENFYSDEDGFQKSSATIAILSKLRHITGISKVSNCIEFVTEFLLSTDRKIAIFTHHQDVMVMLENQLNQWCVEGDFGKVLTMHSGLSGDDRTKVAEKFKNDAASRVLLASTLAAGEGLNLQFCSDAILLERQWNPANEEQAEARFHRFGQLNNVSVTYFIASGTIDDHFTKLVEQKRSIISSALDKIEIQWEQQSLMKDLVESLIMTGKKEWKF